MVTQTSRLDIHDQQINQLQQDVTEIKASLSTLMEDSREFRLAFLAWMKSQEKMHVDGSSSFGPSVLDFTSSSIRSDSPAILRSPGSGGNFGEVFPCSHPKFVSNRNVGPKSSDGDLSGGISSVIAQLEALVSRSENRLCGYGHLMLTGHTDSRSSNYEFQFPTPAPLKAIISRSEEHGCLMSHSDDGVMTDNLQGKLGSGIGVGHDVELKLVVGRYTPDLGLFYGDVQFVTQCCFAEFLGPAFKISDRRLGWKGGTLWITRADRVLPFGTLTSAETFFTTELLDIHWQYKTSNRVIELIVGSYHLWIVHGQGRPPENTLGEASVW